MKLPFTINLSAVTGVFSRLNPKAVLGKLKGLADVKGLIAKVKGKSGAAQDEDELEDDGDMFGDLGDLDALDKAANEDDEDGEDGKDGKDGEGEVESDDEAEPEEPYGADGDDSADGDEDGEEGDALSDLEDMPDFDEDEFDDDEDDEDADRAKKKKLALIAGGGVAAAVVLGGVAWLLIGGEDAPQDVAADAPIAPPAGTSVFNLDETPAPRPAAPAADAGALHPPTDAPTGQAAPQPTQAAEASGEPTGSVLEQLGLNVAQEPGAGLVVPSMTKASFGALTPWPPTGPLETSPIAALVEQTDMGPLPMVAEDGRTPFEAYARPQAQDDTGKPKLAIIVTSMGTSRAATDAALLAMPSDVTFALDSYARGLDFWVRKMREYGHEVLLEVPSESVEFPFQDLGPNALQALVPLQENAQKLGFILSRTTGYFGVLSTGGGKFLANEEQVQGLMAHLKHRGLMYVDGGVQGSKGSRVAYKEGVAWAAVELDLDQFEGRAALQRQLAEAENLVQRRAMSVVRVTSTPLTMAQISAWIRGLEAKGIQLVPVSALSKKQLVR